MVETPPFPGPDRRTRDRSKGLLLRRRQKKAVEVERRQGGEGTSGIAAALELHLDQCKTRRALVDLLELWLTEARSAEQSSQDPDYTSAVERSIEIMKGAPDVETGMAMLQRK